jgi:hypothetical protein
MPPDYVLLHRDPQNHIPLLLPNTWVILGQAPTTNLLYNFIMRNRFPDHTKSLISVKEKEPHPSGKYV